MSYYDRFADSRFGGGLLRFVLDGIDRKPSLFQRLLVQSPQHIAYTLDRLGYADNMAKRSLRFTTPTSGSSTARWVRGKFSMTNAYADRERVRSKRVTRKYKRVPKSVRQNYKQRKNLPITITHAESTEVRAKAGTQAIVQFQAERQLPYEQTTGVGALSAGPTGALNPGVNRTVANTRGTYNGGILYNQIYRYASGTADARTVSSLNHRSDWTMFTNASWRDGYATLNSRFSTSATALKGYITPAENYLLTTAEWWVQRIGDNASSGDAFAPKTPLGATDYYHLSETLNVTVTNNASTVATITLYECILAHDVGIHSSPTYDAEVGQAVQWGALPCPVELWRASKRFGGAETQGITMYENGAGVAMSEMAPVAGDDGEGAVGTRMGAPTESATAAFTGGIQGDSAVTTTAPTTTKDIDHHGVSPAVANLLHHWYKLVPHTRVLAPGQTTTIRIKCIFNKRIPGTWWETLAGVQGYSRTFFMMARAAKGVASTGVDEVGVSGPGSRLMMTGPIDLTMNWTKSKSFTRTMTMPRRSLYFAASIPELDTFLKRTVDDGETLPGGNDGGAGAGAGADEAMGGDEI